MTRFQIYLDDSNIETLDYLASNSNSSRSRIIRDLISQKTKHVKSKKTKKEDNPLLKMCGFAKGLPPDLSMRVDEIYHID